jgi:putative ABC transport system permease protein
MTLHNIAYKNIKGNLNKYVMYYLSNTLVVMVFFIFANFIFNPQVGNVKTMGSMGVMAARVMYLCEIVIVTFTVVFTTYSISNFLKSREKEFGLLSMFGLTKSQIRGYVMFENIVVSAASISTGVIFGVLFSKLFFMAIAAILMLKAEIPFSISIKALGITIICFIVLFQVIGFITSYRIKNNNIIELLKGARVAKPVPKFSRVKAVLSIVLIASGYIMAVVSGVSIIITMFPILILTVSGTYLLYSQFSVYFASKLQKNKKVYYKGINMITLSQIIYKLKDNAKILFIVSILGSVTLTASSSVYSFQKSIQTGLMLNYPQDISFIESGLNNHNVIMPEKVESTLKNQGHEINFKSKIVLIKAENVDSAASEAAKYEAMANKKDFYVMSNNDYNTLARKFNRKEINLKQGEALVHSYNFMGPKGNKLFVNNQYLNLNVEGENIKYKLKDEISGGIINADEKSTNTVVISDNDYKMLQTKISDEKKYVYYGYNIKDWMSSAETVSQIKAMVPKAKENIFRERVIDFSSMMKGMSLFFFIGTFISILFFIATGSIIYFKMFSEIQKDRQEFISLKKMGMASEEVKKIIGIQCFIMFFLPFIVAFSHTTFAIKALSNLLGGSLSIYLLTIVGIYLLLQAIYYAFAKSMYTKQINNWGL